MPIPQLPLNVLGRVAAMANDKTRQAMMHTGRNMYGVVRAGLNPQANRVKTTIRAKLREAMKAIVSDITSPKVKVSGNSLGGTSFARSAPDGYYINTAHFKLGDGWFQIRVSLWNKDIDIDLTQLNAKKRFIPILSLQYHTGAHRTRSTRAGLGWAFKSRLHKAIPGTPLYVLQGIKEGVHAFTREDVPDRLSMSNIKRRYA